MEGCSVCFNDEYKQNENFICIHPLCQDCYNKLDDKKCPICRSYKRKFIYEPVLIVSVNGTIKQQPINKLIKYVFSKRYKNYFNKLLKKKQTDYDFIKQHGFLSFEGKDRMLHEIIIYNYEFLPFQHITFDDIYNLLYYRSSNDNYKHLLLDKLKTFYEERLNQI